MKKRIFLFLIIANFLALQVTAETYSGTCGTNLNWSLNTETGILDIVGSGAMSNYSLDGPPWWNYHNDITKINLPEGLTTVGGSVFTSCIEVKTISIPESVTVIYEYAFSSCGLTSLYIPKNVTNIYKGAFSGCTSLTSLTCEAPTPPKPTKYSWDTESQTDIFADVDKSIPLYVPETSINDYKTADQWKDFTNIRAIKDEDPAISEYTLTVKANNDAWGNVSGGGTYKAGEEVIISAVPKEGYKFSTWDDGNTNSMRTITVLSDSVFTAIFEEINTVPAGKRVIYLNTGGHWWGNDYDYYIYSWYNEYNYNLTQFEYVADYLYKAIIDQYDDYALIFYVNKGETVAPFNEIWEDLFWYHMETTIPSDKDMYVITSTWMSVWSATEYGEWANYDAAKSAVDYAYGSCGTNLEYEVKRTNTLVITGTGAMTHYKTQEYSEDPRWNWAPWESWRYMIDSISLPEGLTTIGTFAFELCHLIKSITIPESVQEIGSGAFNAQNMTSITCKAKTPPAMVLSTSSTPVKHLFQNADFSIPVYVPSNAVEAYKKADYWKNFTNIRAIGSEEGGGEGGEGGNEPPAGAIPLDMDAILIDYFPTYNSAIGYDYSLYMYKNDKSAGYMPELVLDIQTPTHKDFVGEYSIAKGNMELDYCGLYLSADNEKGYELFGLTDVYCQISLADGQYTVTGYVTASDEKSYSFNVTAEAYFEDAEHLYEPETPQILDIAIQSADINLESIERGVMRVTFDTSDEEWISLLFVTKDTESTTLPDGVYNITTNSYESFLAGYSRSDSYYNSLAKIGGNMYYLTEGTVIVKSISKGKYFDVEATSFYGTKFKFSYLIADGDSDGILTISVAQALDLAESLEYNDVGTVTYNIIGYVTAIIYNDFNTSYQDITFWIADTNNGASSNAEGGFYVYRGKPDIELKVGDKVQVTTRLTNYEGIIESVSKAQVLLLEREDDPTPDVTKYTISVAANDSRLGTVKGGGTYNQGTQITLTASANKGARFDKWSDGVTTATRTITVSSNTTYTAIFKAVTSSNAGKLADGYNQYDEKSGVAEPAKEPKRIPVATTTQKIIHDGHIYILIEGHVYDAQGRKIK